jgi:hypothetical protein
MPPTILPPHLRHVAVIAGDTRNQLNQLVSRQGLDGGSEGPAGPTGSPGPPGASASTFVFTEGAPSTTWKILHKLKRFPSVTVIDTAGDEVQGITTYNSNEELTIVFSAPVTGEALLN